MTDLVILFSISRSTGEVTHYDPPLPLEAPKKPVQASLLTTQQKESQDKFLAAWRTL
jgi:hypothetical protein